MKLTKKASLAELFSPRAIATAQARLEAQAGKVESYTASLIPLGVQIDSESGAVSAALHQFTVSARSLQEATESAQAILKAKGFDRSDYHLQLDLDPELILIDAAQGAESKSFTVAPGVLVKLAWYEEPGEESSFILELQLDQIEGVAVGFKMGYSCAHKRDIAYIGFGPAEAEKFYLKALDNITLIINNQIPS